MNGAERPVTPPARILIADEEVALRQSLAHVIDDEPDLTVAAQAGDQDSVAGHVARTAPALALVSSRLPGPAGAPQLARRWPDTLTLLLLKDDDAWALAPALESGAAGGVELTTSLDGLLANIRAALRGETCVPRRLLGELLREIIQRNRYESAEQERLARLSPREQEVLVALARGSSVTDIAEQFFVSKQTVRSHVQNLMRKLDVHSRLELVQLGQASLSSLPGGDLEDAS